MSHCVVFLSKLVLVQPRKTGPCITEILLMGRKELNQQTILHRLRERSVSVLDSRPKDRKFGPHRLPCVVSLHKNINPSLVLVQPMKTPFFDTERLLMGCIESNQT